MFGLQAEIVQLPEWADYFLNSQLFWAQVVFTIIIVVTFGLIATERLHKTVAALGGAVATLIAGGYFAAAYNWVPYFKGFLTSNVITSELLFSFEDVYKEFISWSTILIIISIVIITTVASRSGLFEYLIVKVIKFSGGDIRRLFLYIWILAFALTMVLGNNSTFIIVSVLVLLLTRILDLNPIPYVLGTVFVVNAASASTVIGSFVNILVPSFYWLTFSPML